MTPIFAGEAGMNSVAPKSQTPPDQQLYDDMARVREASGLIIDRLERELHEQRRVHEAAAAACRIFEKAEPEQSESRF